MLPALNDISVQQSKPTPHKINECNHLIDYSTTYPNIVIRYHASDIILHVDTDTTYLVLPKAHSRITGHFCLSDRPPTNETLKKTERSRSHHLPNTQTCCGLISRSGNKRDVPQWTGNVPNPTHHHRHGLPSTRQWQFPQVQQKN